MTDSSSLQTLVNQAVLAQATELARAGHYAEAEETLRQQEATPAVLDLRARIHAQQRHWREAQTAWLQALEPNPACEAYRAGLEAVRRAQRRPRLSAVVLPVMGALLIFLGGLFSGRFFFPPLPAATLTPISILLSKTTTQMPSPTATPTPTLSVSTTSIIVSTPAPLTCRVSTKVWSGNLNVRSGPDTSYSGISLLHEGEQVVIQMEYHSLDGDEWLSILTESGLKGWINAGFCQ